jgi:hypothetical protein
MPTHSRTQIFRFDTGLRLLSLEYTAEVMERGWLTDPPPFLVRK